MIHINPLDLPELRAELNDWTYSAVGRSYWSWRQEQRRDRSEGIAKVDALFSGAELYFVAAPMADLAIQASKSLPDFALAAEDLPARRGMLLAASHLYTQTGEEDKGLIASYPIRGYAWVEHPDGAGVFVSFLVDRESYIDAIAAPEEDAAWRRAHLPRMFERIGVTFWPYDAPDLAERAAFTEDETSPPLILKSIWLLMQQPVSAVSDAPYDRKTRRRLARKDIEPPAIRLITLRRTAIDSIPGTEARRDYQHQWIVRGHWRQQWYPLRQVHRPVWIAPHIKGPEGAPLIGGEKVHVWRR